MTANTDQPTLYDKIVAITADYLGPAAQRFIDRQIQNHLGKEPAELGIGDLPTLIEWIRVSMAFLTEDRQLIDDYTVHLRQLTENERI